jgi:predicted AAA+ superfamily ATPase
MTLLRGIDRQCDILTDNTRRFATGLPANNALLWGARGMGKSSLVKAVQATVASEHPGTLALVEIHREDIPSLPALLAVLRGADRRFIIFCDDLSFDGNDSSYKSLKAVLDGGVEGRPANIVFYATSNRRHLLSRDRSRTSARPRSTRARRSRRRCRCRTASACGSASTTATRTPTWPWSAAMPTTTASRSATTTCGGRRTSGR